MIHGIALPQSQQGITCTQNLLPKYVPIGVTNLRGFPQWDWIETAQSVPATYDWTMPEQLKTIVNANRVTLSYDLSFLSHWYSSAPAGTTAPNNTIWHPCTNLNAFRNYITTVVNRYNPASIEIYNEFNNPAFNIAGLPVDYARLVVNAFEVAKAINPGILVAITCAESDALFLQSVILAGCRGSFDVVCLHPYQALQQTQSCVACNVLGTAISVVQAMLTQVDPRPIPIWVTEMGIPTTDAASQTAQAQALVKGLTLCQAAGVARAYWYARPPIPGGTTADSKQDFSLFNPDGSTKPGFVAWQTLLRLCPPTTTAIVACNNTSVVVTYSNGVRVAWGSSTIALNGAHVIQMDGSQLPVAGGTLQLTSSPVFLVNGPVRCAWPI